MTPNAWLTGSLIAALATIGINRPAGEARAAAVAEPQFELVQPELFAAAGGQPNCWADFDNDGDLDLFVGFRQGEPNRAVSQRQRHVRQRRRGARGRRPQRHPRRLVGRLRRRWRHRSVRRIHAQDRHPEQALSQRGRQASRSWTSRKPWASTRRARPGSRRSSITTTTATSISSSACATRRTCSSATTARRSRASARRWASTIRAAPSAPSGSTWIRTAISTSSSANQNGDLNGLFRNDGDAVRGRGEGTRHGCRRPAADLRQQWPERRRLRQRRRSRSVRRRIRREFPLPQ